jgi:hypothetical protein
MKFTEVQEQVIEGFTSACIDKSIVIFPVKNKLTGEIVPCVAVELPEDIVIPIGFLFTPHQDDLSKYEFPDGFQDVDSVDGVDFVYSDNDDESDESDEEDEPVKLGFFARLKNRLLNR